MVHCTSICMRSKSVSQSFKILFQTGDVNSFVLLGVFLSRYVQLKNSVPAEINHWRWNLRHTFVEKLSNFNVAKYQKQIPSLTEVGALQSCS